MGSATGGGISGGQKRKLQLAIEMLASPAVLILDEPTSGLDTRSALDVIRSLRTYCDSGRAIAVSIHQPRVEVHTHTPHPQALCNLVESVAGVLDWFARRSIPSLTSFG